MTKKTLAATPTNKELAGYLQGKHFYYGDSCTCPVCNKVFVLTQYHKYIVHKAYTCSWECFLDEVKRHQADKEAAKATTKKALVKLPEAVPEEPKKVIIEEKLEELW